MYNISSILAVGDLLFDENMQVTFGSLWSIFAFFVAAFTGFVLGWRGFWLMLIGILITTILSIIVTWVLTKVTKEPPWIR